MAKVIHCKDGGFDCAEVVRGQTEEEVLQKAAEHAQAVHSIQVTPEMAQQVKTLIKEE